MEKLSLEEQIRECFGRVVYTHKCHEKMADQNTIKLGRLKAAQIWATALTSSGAVSVAVLDEKCLEIVTALLALITLVLAAYMKNFELGELSQKHRDAASDIWSIRESYMSLLADMSRLPIDEIVRRRDELQEQLAAIYRGAPQTDANAYTAAQAGLKLNEEYMFTPEEIDMFLPPSLRRGDSPD